LKQKKQQFDVALILKSSGKRTTPQLRAESKKIQKLIFVGGHGDPTPSSSGRKTHSSYKPKALPILRDWRRIKAKVSGIVLSCYRGRTGFGLQ